MNIGPANASDEAEIKRILAAVDLPTSDLTTASLKHFLLLRDQGQIIGTVGLDLAGDVALLRSLAVEPRLRGLGYGQALVEAAERLAGECGVGRLYLLTTSADRFFASHLYAVTPRDQAPLAIQSMPQFAGLCPSSSTFMSKSL